jgi:hypothetical protein
MTRKSFLRSLPFALGAFVALPIARLSSGGVVKQMRPRMTVGEAGSETVMILSDEKVRQIAKSLERLDRRRIKY